MGKHGGFTEKRRETHDFTPFSCCFPPFSLDFTVKHRDFKRFRRVTEENRAFHSRFHAVLRRFLRSRSCSPCFVSGRENAQKRRGAAFPSAKIPKPSPGVPLSTGERRQGNGIPPPSGRSRTGFPHEKILRGSSFSSAPLALCEVCLIAGKMLQNHSKINTISIILLKNIFMV